MDTLLHTLNPQQREAVLATEGPVLILAGAGSGKTRVLTVRVAYLIREKGVPPWQILAVTFTNKAAREMKERIERLVGTSRGLWIGTFHATFAKILRQEGTRLGLSPNFGIYDEEDRARLIKSILAELQIASDHFSPKAIGSVVSLNKNSLIFPEAYRDRVTNLFEEVVAKVYPVYQKRLWENQALDFDDLITLPIRLFEDHPDMLEKYQDRFRYVLVDEYQDTNRAQYRLISLLSRRHRNLCVVGDDDQSIYGWRGADLRNILDFEKEFRETRVFKLEQNYRSTRNILKAASSVVAHNLGRKGKTLWSEGPEGEKIGVIEAEDDHDEAARVVAWIQYEVFRNKRALKDFVVLYRTNAQSRAIEEALRRAGISYLIVGGVRFYERKEVKDVLAYLKLIVNPRDTISLKRIINFPPRGIGDVTLAYLESRAIREGKSLFSVLPEAISDQGLSDRARVAVETFYRLISKYQMMLTTLSPMELAHALVEESGILTYYKNDTTLEGMSRYENVRELLHAVEEYMQHEEKPTLAGFLEEVALVTDIDTWDETSNAVTLMTLHMAKGLEFPVVFIMGLEETLLPVMRSLDRAEAIEEERRLFYVGLTRAKEKVYLSWAKIRSHYGEGRSRFPSRFLKEIDPSLLEPTVYPEAEVPARRRGRRGPVLGSQDYPDYENDSQELIDLRKGMRVFHPVYGRGEIVALEGRGKNMRIVILFDTGETKKFVAQYAHFEIC